MFLFVLSHSRQKPSDFMARMRNVRMSGQLGYQRLTSFQAIFYLTEPMIIYSTFRSVRFMIYFVAIQIIILDQSDVQTLMCYLGVGDTFTPFHKDLCASSGQNLMCYTENGGSSFWFMTESSAAPAMAEFFQTMNEELDFETHVVTLKELGQSRLKIYIAEQTIGDLVLVPPRSCHQVINNGGITMKTSWSRMTLKGLSNSLYHELPVYHRYVSLSCWCVLQSQ